MQHIHYGVQSTYELGLLREYILYSFSRSLAILQDCFITSLYIVMKNDLCTVSAVNDIFQYADDIDTEFQNV